MINDLYFKNGKQKKKFELCESREHKAQFKRLYGREIVQCAGMNCPYYALGCRKNFGY